jgi:hypothetical protein
MMIEPLTCLQRRRRRRHLVRAEGGGRGVRGGCKHDGNQGSRPLRRAGEGPALHSIFLFDLLSTSIRVVIFSRATSSCSAAA